MAREIKFRAWAGGVMVYFGLFDITEQISDSNFQPQFRRISPPQCTVSTMSPIMQFTGLKDKDNKEIYESDVVHDEGEYSGNKVVVWDEGLCQFKFNHILGHPLAHGCERYLTVIGNIYENPELVGLTK